MNGSSLKNRISLLEGTVIRYGQLKPTGDFASFTDGFYSVNPCHLHPFMKTARSGAVFSFAIIIKTDGFIRKMDFTSFFGLI